MGSSSSIQSKLKGHDAAFLYSDYIIEIDTILDIKQGWKISTKVPKYPIEENTTGFVLGVLGFENNAKANLINRVCGYGTKFNNINYNSLDACKGLKVRLSKLDNKIGKKGQKIDKSRLVCLFGGQQDTAIYYSENEMMMKFLNKKFDLKGTSNTIEKPDHLDANTYEDLKLMVINDKIMTERFIDEYILDTCQGIVILIKDLNFQDQKYVENILNRYQNRKKIMIIHHLPNENSILGVKQFIELKLKNLFLVKETYLDLGQWFPANKIQDNFYNKSIFVQQDVTEHLSLINEDERIHVVHLILAKENTIAGIAYNIPTYRYIEEYVKKSIESKSVFNMVESFHKFLNTKYSHYFQIIKKPHENVNEIKVKTVNKNNLLFLTPEIAQQVKMNHFESLQYSILGEPFPFDKKDYVPYQLIEKTKNFEIFLDIPFLQKNMTKVQLDQLESNFQYLNISGYKSKGDKKDVENNISIDYINEIIAEKGTSQFGPFDLRIPIAPHSMRLKKKIECIYKDGILSIILWKSSKNFLNIDIQVYEKEIFSKDNLGNSGSNGSFKNLLINVLDEDEKCDKKNKQNLLNKFEEIAKNSEIKSKEEGIQQNFESNMDKISDEVESEKVNRIDDYNQDSNFKAGFANREVELKK